MANFGPHKQAAHPLSVPWLAPLGAWCAGLFTCAIGPACARELSGQNTDRSCSPSLTPCPSKGKQTNKPNPNKQMTTKQLLYNQLLLSPGTDAREITSDHVRRDHNPQVQQTNNWNPQTTLFRTSSPVSGPIFLFQWKAAASLKATWATKHVGLSVGVLEVPVQGPAPSN